MFQPDFNEFLAVLSKEKPSRPVLFEFFMNDDIYKRLVGPAISAIDDKWAYIRRMILAFQTAGYDYATVNTPFNFPKADVKRDKTHSLNAFNTITDRESFYKYKWPEIDEIDYGCYEYAAQIMPDGMRIMADGPGGLLENVIQLTGYDNLCYMLYEDPDLVEMLCTAIGQRLYRHYERVAAMEGVGVLMINDDWGFNTQTMLPPDAMRKYFFPWHEAYVWLAHNHGKPAILHSCGFFGEVMEDVIAMGFDAKHSYEDNIMPVEQAYELMRGRLAVLGGIDLDYVITKPAEDVYARSSNMLKRGMEGGGYALGTGNSVPYYVPYEQYEAMIRAAHDLRVEG